jgi:hypothetical protein
VSENMAWRNPNPRQTGDRMDHGPLPDDHGQRQWPHQQPKRLGNGTRRPRLHPKPPKTHHHRHQDTMKIVNTLPALKEKK